VSMALGGRPAGRALPPAILCIGRNYGAHAAEMGAERPERPMVFAKNPAAVVGDGEAIVIPPICREHGPQVDFEGEIAVVIGPEDVRDVPRDRALDAVAGYAAANDVSARWWQKNGAGGQFVRGKSFDTFCPLGPTVVPAASIEDPQQLTLTTRLNGEMVQHASTSAMLFGVANAIHRLSQGATLPAGTVILTGTPAGVGAAKDPPRFLREGDVVEVEISGIGVLRNRVVEE